MSIAEKLEQILVSKQFENLNEFKDSEKWPRLKRSERDLLVLLFILQGENQLANSIENALDSFRIAAEIASNNTELLFKIVIALANHEDAEAPLLFSIGIMDKINQLLSSDAKTYHYLGNLLIRLGTLIHDQEALLKANQKFAEGEKYLSELNTEDYMIYQWHWGLCQFCLGKISEEASDYYKAISHFKLAMEKGLDLPKFWNDYGNALVDLSFFLGRTEILHEAIKTFHNAIERQPDYSEPWLNLACCYQHLYYQFFREEDFIQADKFFTEGARLFPDVMLFAKWAEMLLQAGKRTNNLEYVKRSSDLYGKAIELEPEVALFYTRRAEALVLYAFTEEDLHMIKEAETIIIRGLKLKPNEPESWYVYGLCLNAQGGYFDDANFYYQAIDKFQQGLNLSLKQDFLWYGMAVSYFELGELTNNPELVEKSEQYFNRTLEFGINLSPQFWNDWGITLLKLGEIKLEKSYIEAAMSKFYNAINSKLEGDQDASVNVEFLYNYSCALDLMGNITGEIDFFEEALHVLAKIQQQDPQDSAVHYSFGSVFSHLGILTSEIDCFQKANEHFHLYVAQHSEDESAWNDWGISLMEFAELVKDPGCPSNSQQLFNEAEQKIFQSIALGNVYAYYSLACLYSLTGNFTDAMHYLERAQHANALPAIDDLMHDEWLENMRDNGLLNEFISSFKND